MIKQYNCLLVIGFKHMNEATPFIPALPILVRNIIMLLTKQFHIGSVTGLRSAVLVLGLWPLTNKANQGPSN